MSRIDDEPHEHLPRAGEATGVVRTRGGATGVMRALATVLDAAQDGMGIFRDGHWVHVNASLARHLGAASPAQVEGTEVLSYIHPLDQVVADARVREALASRVSPPRVLRVVGRTGVVLELEVSLTPVVDEDSPGLCLAVTRDLTERRRVLHQFVAADRTAALGALAASVAHGINTPLTQVFGNAAMMKGVAREMLERMEDRWTRGDLASVRGDLRTLIECAGQLHEGVTSVAGITRAMGLFSFQSDPDTHRVELGPVLDAVIDLTENVIRQRARLVCEIGILPEVSGSEARIGHLILSALLASAEAVPEGDAQRHEVRIRASASDGGVRIEITDSGAPRELLGDSTVDPMTAFERAAPHGEMTLAVCRALAADVGGALDVTPLSRGTMVVIHLPVAPPRTPRPKTITSIPPPPLAEPESARGRVLVVDDERVFLDLMCRILKLDHEVTGVIDPAEALERIERGERYDVILCDMMMPSMTGADLHAAIARIAPHVARRMVFLTAGAFTERTRSFLASGEVTWLEKPIEPDNLRSLVNARVAAHRG